MTKQKQNHIKIKNTCIIIVAICSAITLFTLLRFFALGESSLVHQNASFKVCVKLMPLSVFLLFALFGYTQITDKTPSIQSKISVCDRIAFGLSSIVLLSDFFLSRNIYCLVCIFFAIVLCLYGISMLFVRLKEKYKCKSLGFGSLAVIVFIIPAEFNARHIQLVKSIFPVVPWVFGVVGLFVSILYIVLNIKKYPFKYDKITIVAIVFLCCTLSVYIPNITLKTINHSLAPSEPVRKHCRVVDKHIELGRHRRLYYITVKISDSKETLKVSKDIFENVEKTELLAIDFYQGALGVEYFIPDYF